MKDRRTFVTLVTQAEIVRHWGPGVAPKGHRYIRCNENGKVNWPAATLWSSEDLIKKNNVVIVKRNHG